MKPRILLIDDSESVQTAVSSMLTLQDYLLTTASSGAEGLSCIERQPYDLVLLDYSLPDTNGLDLLRSILNKNPDMPVIMVTGSGSERIAVKALKSGASDYVVKSSDFISKLPHVVRDNLDRYEMKRRNRELEGQLRDSFKQVKHLNRELEEKVQARTEELERAYQLSNELMAKSVDSNMQLAELYGEVDESRRKSDARIRELSFLNTIGKTIASILDRDKLLQVTVDAVHQELGVEHCAILLFNEDTRHFHIGASRGTPDDLLLAAKSLNGERILLDILQRDTPLLIQDVESHEQFHALAQDYPGVECFILLPLRTKSVNIGVLTLYGYGDSATFTNSELEFAAVLASQTSIGLTNIVFVNQRIQEEQMITIGKMANYLAYDSDISLSVIRNAAQLFSTGHLEPEPSANISQQILAEIDQLVRMHRELVEFSAKQRGTLKLQTVSVKEFVGKIEPQIAQRFFDKHVHFRLDLQYTEQCYIDVEKLAWVFLHIANKSRYAMSGTGTFSIVSILIENKICFEFCDEGCGVFSGLQSYIFSSVISEGMSFDSWLGMAMVKKIVDEHRGQIDMQHVADKGTSIRLFLPCPQAAGTREEHTGTL